MNALKNTMASSLPEADEAFVHPKEISWSCDDSYRGRWSASTLAGHAIPP